jgi:hypothetical protein
MDMTKCSQLLDVLATGAVGRDDDGVAAAVRALRAECRAELRRRDVHMAWLAGELRRARRDCLTATQ